MKDQSEFHYTQTGRLHKLASWEKTMTLSMNILNAWIKSAIAACAPAGKQVPAPQKALGLSNHLKEDIGIGDASPHAGK
ncbi:hypothetical protein [Rhizobium sp. OAE497]|uniref:hypothetical protein n=1 Tax=Rhizobium sp. OAE497 TaxID=2663796 RepID=UPI0018F786A6